jgi:hypothetical protein
LWQATPPSERSGCVAQFRGGTIEGWQVIIFAKHIGSWALLKDMTNPLIQAFFLGRATAEVLSEELESGFTNLLSEVGKFDAEQRERLRQFTQQVMDRAATEASTASQTRKTPESGATANGQLDLQEIIDELRAEIAQLRSALQTHRQQAGPS